MWQNYTDIAVKHAIDLFQKFYIVLKHFMHVCSINKMLSIAIITIFLLKCWTQTYSIDLTTNGKVYIRRLLLWCLHMLYHSTFFSPPVLHVSGWLLQERLSKIRSIWEGRVSFHSIIFVETYTFCYKLYLTVPFFVGFMQMMTTILFSPIPCIQLAL